MAEYVFRVPCTTIIYVTAESEQAARTMLAEIDDEEIEVTARWENGAYTKAMSADTTQAQLLEKDGTKCRHCPEPYDYAGDGWNGYCPNCADRVYAHQEGKHAKRRRKNCPLCA